MTAKNNTNLKLYVIIAVCCSTLLIAICAWVYIKKQELAQRDRLENQHQQVKNDAYFDKKQSCSKLVSGIKQGLEEDNNNQFALGVLSFETIFYSPKEDACLYAIHRLTIKGEETSKREYLVYNALTHNLEASFKFPDQFEEYKKYVLDRSNGEVKL